MHIMIMVEIHVFLPNQNHTVNYSQIILSLIVPELHNIAVLIKLT